MLVRVLTCVPGRRAKGHASGPGVANSDRCERNACQRRWNVEHAPGNFVGRVKRSGEATAAVHRGLHLACRRSPDAVSVTFPRPTPSPFGLFRGGTLGAVWCLLTRAASHRWGYRGYMRHEVAARPRLDAPLGSPQRPWGPAPGCRSLPAHEPPSRGNRGGAGSRGPELLPFPELAFLPAWLGGAREAFLASRCAPGLSVARETFLPSCRLAGARRLMRKCVSRLCPDGTGPGGPG